MSVNRTKIAALILAAGAGRRFGGGKQWADYRGQPLLSHSIGHCLEAGCDPIWVVTGYAHEQVAKICQAYGADTIYHEQWEQGMASSVNFGLSKLLEQVDWQYLLVMAGDMPWFDPTVFMTNEVVEHYENIPAQSWGVALEENSNLVLAIQYPEGVGMPLLIPRSFVRQHCYFASQSNQPNYRLKDSLQRASKLVTLPAGKHTKDVDTPGDMLEN